MTSIYQGEVNEQEAIEISELMRITNNIERIGDGIENVFKIIERIDDMRLSMSQEALDDLQTIANEVHTFMQLVIQELHEKTENFLSKAKVLENRIDQIRERLRAQHIERLRHDECSVDAGVLFITLISTYEKMGDYCFNISRGLEKIS